MTAYPIPAEALDDRLAFVGTSGSGKTYNAGGGVERLLASKARVVIVDPLDVWWGLRLRADGEAASKFKVVVFGGSHGDIPLTEGAGGVLGEAVAKMAESCIVSLGGFPSAAAERRFMLGFLTALYRHAAGEPFHLVLDEADAFAPQQIMDKEGDAMKLKGMVDKIVRRGRVRGFIPWLITQRPAVLSKDVLSQSDGLIAFKLTSSQDRDAIGAWIEGQADRATGKEILASLPSMQLGQGVVWVPGRSVLTTAIFPQKVTYDSSRTPKRGEVVRSTSLKALDVGALQAQLAQVEAEAKASDPKVLRAEVARLTRELAQAKASGPAADPKEIDAAYQRGLVEGEERGRTVGVALGITRAQAAVNALQVPEIVAQAPAAVNVVPAPARAAPGPAARISRPAAPPKGDGAVPPGCDRPLAALAGVYPAGMTEAQWATAAGYKRTGGTWGTYKSRLRTAGMIEAREGRFFATQAGASAVGDVEVPPPPGPDLVRWWAAKLPGVTKMAEALIEAGTAGLDRDTLAARIGMSAAGGSFGTYLSRLSSAGLIDRSGGIVRLTAEVFG